LNCNEEMELGSVLWLAGNKNLNLRAAYIHQEGKPNRERNVEYETALGPELQQYRRPVMVR
jgi:hypothetical protein